MEEAQIKQIIERQPLHGSALLDPRCKILLLVCIGFVSYFLAGEVVSLALMLVYGLFIALGNGGKWAVKMIVIYIIVAYLNALLRYVQVPVLSVIMSVFGVTVLKLIPIMMMGLWILRTTYMDDLMVALQRMRLPQAVTIPLVVMFRYIIIPGICDGLGLFLALQYGRPHQLLRDSGGRIFSRSEERRGG